MFERRKVARAKAQSDDEPVGPAEERSPPESPAGGEAAQPGHSLELSAICACGHARRDHRGLRIEVTGPCLECACEAFRPAHDAAPTSEQIIQRVRAGIDRVERLQESVGALSAQVSEETLDREELLALQREFCGATVVSVDRVGLYVGAQEAMLVLGLGNCPFERWRLLWRGAFDSAAR
jgi:hypothetical protein